MRTARAVGLFGVLLASAPLDRLNAQPPIPEEAQNMLQANPALVAQLRSRLRTNGLTPEQVRARLRAEGYQETLLDSYLAGSTGPAAVPGREVFAAVRALGLVEDPDLEELMRLGGNGGGGARGTEQGDRTADSSARAIFGLSLFRESSSLFLPNLDGPVDANYKLGPGDQLVLILTGDVELVHTLDVAREGFIVIPQVGQLSVANLTVAQLETLLYDRLARSYSGVRRDASATTRFSVTVSRLRSNQVFVAGDVRAPGSYRVTSAGTVLTALYAAGGPSDIGSLRRVEVRRGGKVVGTLDVYDYLLHGDASRDLRLQQGDLVFVPVAGARVTLRGAVARPAAYELLPGETLQDAVAAAGGLTQTAGGRRLVIERVLPVEARSDGLDRAVIDVPLLAGGQIPAFAVEKGDLITVPSVADRVRGSITVGGHVWYPGSQGLTPGLTLSEALARAGGAQSDAYLPVVHIARRLADGRTVMRSAALRDSTGAMDAPFLLQEDDSITVFSRSSFRQERFVTIDGAVNGSGRFAWREGMTLRDLVLLAGGLADSAWLDAAEIARVPVGDTGRTDLRLVRVVLDSSYLAANGTPVSSRNVPLAANDRVTIYTDPSWHGSRSIVITGEVRFPGRYGIRSRTERLSDVIARAGGITSDGDALAAYFSRRRPTETVARAEQLERRQQQLAAVAVRDSASAMAFAAANRATATSAQFQRDNSDRIRIGVDLDGVIRNASRRDNLVLVDGDSLHVPQRQQVVSVRGAVNAPSEVAAAQRRGLQYYLDAAGGPTERSRPRRAYVLQPDGRIESRRYVLWMLRLDPTPRPGSTVVVPVKEPDAGDRPTLLQGITVVAQLTATLAAIVAISR